MREEHQDQHHVHPLPGDPLQAEGLEGQVSPGRQPASITTSPAGRPLSRSTTAATSAAALWRASRFSITEAGTSVMPRLALRRTEKPETKSTKIMIATGMPR